jgi:hypothetical protein
MYNRKLWHEGPQKNKLKAIRVNNTWTRGYQEQEARWLKQCLGSNPGSLTAHGKHGTVPRAGLWGAAEIQKNTPPPAKRKEREKACCKATNKTYIYGYLQSMNNCRWYSWLSADCKITLSAETVTPSDTTDARCSGQKNNTNGKIIVMINSTLLSTAMKHLPNSSLRHDALMVNTCSSADGPRWFPSWRPREVADEETRLKHEQNFNKLLKIIYVQKTNRFQYCTVIRWRRTWTTPK